jgi:hypothetical protein
MGIGSQQLTLLWQAIGAAAGGHSVWRLERVDVPRADLARW